jgi:hypothetical protein
MVSWTSCGGSISLSSVRRISMPQLAVSTSSAVRSSSLILPRSELADLSESVPMMLRSVVRARLTTWFS